MQYTCRNAPWSGERTYQLTPEGIETCVRGVRENLLRYSDVRHVTLRFDGVLDGINHYHCIVEGVRFERIHFRSGHCVGMGSFVDQATEYRPFVLALHDRLHDYRDVIQFRSGSWVTYCAALWIVTILPILLLGVMGAVLHGGLKPSARHLGTVVVGLAGWLAVLPVLKVGKPSAYDGAQPPDGLLPAPWRRSGDTANDR